MHVTYGTSYPCTVPSYPCTVPMYHTHVPTWCTQISGTYCQYLPLFLISAAIRPICATNLGTSCGYMGVVHGYGTWVRYMGTMVRYVGTMVHWHAVVSNHCHFVSVSWHPLFLISAAISDIACYIGRYFWYRPLYRPLFLISAAISAAISDIGRYIGRYFWYRPLYRPLSPRAAAIWSAKCPHILYPLCFFTLCARVISIP